MFQGNKRDWPFQFKVLRAMFFANLRNDLVHSSITSGKINLLTETI